MHLFAQSKLSCTLDDHTWGESPAGLWFGFCWPSVRWASPAARESTLFWCLQSWGGNSSPFWNSGSKDSRLSVYPLAQSHWSTLWGALPDFFPELGNFLFLAFNSKFPRDTQNYSSWKVGIFLFSIKIWGPSKQFFFLSKWTKLLLFLGGKKFNTESSKFTAYEK